MFLDKTKKSGWHFFRINPLERTLRFILDVGIRVEIIIHPSGKKIKSDIIDKFAQEMTIKTQHSGSVDPIIYKWEYGSTCKLKKEDRDWHENKGLLESIEIVLENSVESWS